MCTSTQMEMFYFVGTNLTDITVALKRTSETAALPDVFSLFSEMQCKMEVCKI